MDNQIKRAILQENEECAKVCESFSRTAQEPVAKEIARRIRERHPERAISESGALRGDGSEC